MLYCVAKSVIRSYRRSSSSVYQIKHKQTVVKRTFGLRTREETNKQWLGNHLERADVHRAAANYIEHYFFADQGL